MTLVNSFDFKNLKDSDKKKVMDVYDCLKKKASEGCVMTYTDLNITCNLDFNFNNIDDRNRISHILGYIARTEVEAERPMLSAIVILKGHSPLQPAHGFHSYAEKLGIHTKDKDDIFWAKELRRCFDYWRNNESN